MARIHTRKKGKSGSTKPLNKKVKTWVRYNDKEVEKLVLKLRKKGLAPSQIGLKLRDQYGIPSTKDITGKTITQILEDNDESLEIPEDLRNLFEKYVSVYEHFERNHQDNTAKKGIRFTKSKINRLVKYYKSEGKLPEDFRFNYDVAKKIIA
ncbi:MAG: 30S ribosomal protein S15 [Candidatus Woesearchaeota archaeon]